MKSKKKIEKNLEKNLFFEKNDFFFPSLRKNFFFCQMRFFGVFLTFWDKRIFQWFFSKVFLLNSFSRVFLSWVHAQGCEDSMLPAVFEISRQKQWKNQRFFAISRLASKESLKNIKNSRSYSNLYFSKKRKKKKKEEIMTGKVIPFDYPKIVKARHTEIIINCIIRNIREKYHWILGHGETHHS